MRQRVGVLQGPELKRIGLRIGITKAIKLITIESWYRVNWLRFFS